MGITMCFFLRNYWKDSGKRLPSLWIVMSACGYALSAYSVQYYLFPWLDIAAVFPLLIYAFLKMIRKETTWRLGKYSITYLLLLTLIFIMHIPQSYMVCLYLILIAGCCFYFRERNTLEERAAIRRGVLKFGLLSILALGLSFFIFLPGAISIMESGRMSGNSSSLLKIYFRFLREEGSDPGVKRIMFYSMLLPLIYIISTWKAARRKKHFIAECVLLLAAILPVFCESINVLWLMGPYHGFPMRFGYMMIFTILAVAGNHMIEHVPAYSDQNPYIFLSSKKKWECAASLLWIISIVGLSLWLMQSKTAGEEGSFVQNSEEITAILPSDTDLFHKTKLADSSLNNNYPLITRTCAFSNYTHLVSQSQIDFNELLGYSQNWTRISDTGGTLFSDALLGYQTTFKTTLAGEQGFEYHSDRYDLYQNPLFSERFAAYTNKYNYSPGLTVSKEALEAYHNSVAEAIENPFELQNALSELFFGETIFTVSEYEIFDEETIAFPVSGIGVLYLYSDDLENSVISVNGTEVPVPDFFYGITDNTYPSFFHTGILSLGCYTDETAKINIRHQSWVENIKNSHLSIAVLDLDKFIETTERETCDLNYTMSSSGLRLIASAREQALLYLPLYADSGWKCTVNGSACSLQSLSDTFILIPLQSGENIIELNYQPIGMQTGIIISLLSLAVLLLWCAASIKWSDNNGFSNIYQGFAYAANYIFLTAFAVYMLLIYIFPILYSIIK